MRSLVALAAFLLLALPGAAGADEVPQWFKTPGGAAYCGSTDAGAWRCVRPADGFWIELIDIYTRQGVDAVGVRQGYSASYRGARRNGVQTLGFGRKQATSDAEVVRCWSRRSGVTCSALTGLSFQLGRTRGHRSFYDKPGVAPILQPLFRIRNGVRCAIDLDTLVPEYPILWCWRPADGLVVGINDRAGRGAHYRDEYLLRQRPAGYTLLGPAGTFTWRCLDVTETTAERCSPTKGVPVITCTNEGGRVTCENRRGRGFWVDGRAFDVFPAAARPRIESEPLWLLRTPGGGAYCGIDSTETAYVGFLCVRPADGFWIRLGSPGLVRGWSARYRGFVDPSLSTLRRGHEYSPTDANNPICVLLRTGLTCRSSDDGLAFWLGGEHGYRVFYETTGYRPHVRPLFRRGRGVWCGIRLDALEDQFPNLKCWRPVDGLSLTAYPSSPPGGIPFILSPGGAHERVERMIGYRPSGFRSLRPDETMAWYCRSILEQNCGRARPGGPTFTCVNTAARVTCRNQDGRGFWVNSRAFGVL